MYTVIRRAAERRRFSLNLGDRRRIEQIQVADSTVPTSFKSKDYVRVRRQFLLTERVKSLLKANAMRDVQNNLLSQEQRRILKGVVNALEQVLGGDSAISEGLANVLTFDTYTSFHHVTWNGDDDVMLADVCFFVLEGKVEVDFSYAFRSPFSHFEPNVLYEMLPGCYIGWPNMEETKLSKVDEMEETRDSMVTPTRDENEPKIFEKEEELRKMPTASHSHISKSGLNKLSNVVKGALGTRVNIYCKEPTTLLIIPVHRFNQAVLNIKSRDRQAIHSFLSGSLSPFPSLSPEKRNNLIDHLVKHELGIHQSLVAQEGSCNGLILLTKGECRCCRSIAIPGGKSALLEVDRLQPGQVIGLDYLLYKRELPYYIISMSFLTYYCLPEEWCHLVEKKLLLDLHSKQNRPIPNDESLLSIYKDSLKKNKIQKSVIDKNRGYYDFLLRTGPPKKGIFTGKSTKKYSFPNIVVNSALAKPSKRTSDWPLRRESRDIKQLFDKVAESAYKDHAPWIYEEELSEREREHRLSDVDTDEIVRRASLRAEEQRVRRLSAVLFSRDSPRYETELHQESKRTRQVLAFTRLRIRHLQRKLSGSN